MSVLLSIVFLLSSLALGAEHKDFWYKVEPTPSKEVQEKAKTDGLPHQQPKAPEAYDIEWDQKTKKLGALKHWSRDPYIGLGIGYNWDDPLREEIHRRPGALQIQGQFSDMGWRRIQLKGFLDQQSGLAISANIQWTPSRKSSRFFYGVGAGLRLEAQHQLRNFIIFSNYRINGNLGWEWMLNKNSGLRLESDVFASTRNKGIIFSLNYIFRI